MLCRKSSLFLCNDVGYSSRRRCGTKRDFHSGCISVTLMAIARQREQCKNRWTSQRNGYSHIVSYFVFWAKLQQYIGSNFKFRKQLCSIICSKDGAKSVHRSDISLTFSKDVLYNYNYDIL